MPLYYFHLHNDVETHDDQGRDLPDLDAARACAIAAARDLMAENVRKGRLSLDHWIEVVDEQDRQVLDIRFGDCVEIIP